MTSPVPGPCHLALLLGLASVCIGSRSCHAELLVPWWSQSVDTDGHLLALRPATMRSTEEPALSSPVEPAPPSAVVPALPAEGPRCCLQDLADWSSVYVKYVQIFRKLETSYDQLVHPQKRRDMRRALEACMGRMLEVRNWLVRRPGASLLLDWRCSRGSLLHTVSRAQHGGKRCHSRHKAQDRGWAASVLTARCWMGPSIVLEAHRVWPCCRGP